MGLNSLTNQYVSKQTKLQAVRCYCCCCCVCQSILHPLDESVPVYSCYVIPNAAQGKNLSYLICSFQQTNSTAVHRTDFSRNTNWPPYLHKATFNNKGEKFFTPDIDKKALFRASKWYQRSKVCRWTFLCYILVTQTISLPLTFSYILSTNCAVHSHITFKLLTVCNSYCATERTVRSSNPRTCNRFFFS